MVMVKQRTFLAERKAPDHKDIISIENRNIRRKQAWYISKKRQLFGAL